MADASNMTTEARVRLIVGGSFSLDSLGSVYQRIIDAVRADPAAHLRAFEQLLLHGPLSQADIGELDPVALLTIVRPLLPDETRRAAAAVSRRLASAARGREEAFQEATESDEADEISFQRQLIDDRRTELAALLNEETD